MTTANSIILGTCRVDADAVPGNVAFIDRSPMFVSVVRTAQGRYTCTLEPDAVGQDFSDPRIEGTATIEEGAVGPGGLTSVTFPTATTMQVDVNQQLAGIDADFNVVVRLMRRIG